MDIKRDSKYYVTGYKGEDSTKAPFYTRALFFDSIQGNLNRELIGNFNEMIYQHNDYDKYSLIDMNINSVPKKIIIINASSDDLPTSYETARVFKSESKRRGWDIDVNVVNTNNELVNQLDKKPEQVLVISQCVNKKVYNKDLAIQLRNRDIIVVPGEYTAPGSIFSNKDKTYQLLSDNGKRWDMVAKYEKVDVNKKSIEEVVDNIIDVVDKLSLHLGKNKFFIKPVEGGGGLGGFRLIKYEGEYIIPDLSKVTGDTGSINPIYIDIDLNDQKKIKELLYIYNLFKSDKNLYRSYIHVNIQGKHEEQVKNFKDYLINCKIKQGRKMASIRKSKKEIKERLCYAIDKFENKFKKRYIPLVNEHIDFGNWGLRAHFRLNKQGPKLETVYARIFQLAFTPEGVGYVGSDNISNKQTGELEIMRLTPLNNIMVDAVGGKEKLLSILYKCSNVFVKLINLLPPDEKRKVPLRIQLDIAAVSGLIGEVNADTARGLCLASSWNKFVENTTEWFIDAIKYYSWRKKQHANL